MADNYSTSPPSGGGATFASDDIGGVHWPRVKLTVGADGAASDVSDAAPLPIKITDGTDVATVRSLGSTKSLDVAISDGSGNQITSFGGTQYTEGDTDASITGVAALWEDASDTLRAASVTKPLPVQLVALSNQEGCSPSKWISAASTNSTNVKGSAGRIFHIIVSNTNASPRWLKLYDKATAPTIGTDTPVHTIIIPGGSSGAAISLPHPIEFANGIGFGLTTGVTDADTGAVAANEIVLNLGWL